MNITNWSNRKDTAVEVSTLHSVTEDLAGYLSEVTQGDLRSPTHLAGCDIGDLYVDLLNGTFARPRQLHPNPPDNRARGWWTDPL